MLALALLGIGLGWVLWRLETSEREQNRITSTKSEDVQRLESFENRLSGKRRRVMGVWEKKLHAIWRRGESVRLANVNRVRGRTGFDDVGDN